jgi:hypothetical protein
MAHELIPRSGRFLPASEVARLLSTVFSYVRTDPVDGLKQAIARAEWIERAPARLFLGHLEEAHRFAAMLRNLAPGEALTIEFGDDPSRKILKIVVLPGESIKFGYASKDEEILSRDLVERCARVLDCAITLI